MFTCTITSLGGKSELVVPRHLEQLSMREPAAVLNVSGTTARCRQRHVLERLADLIPEIQQ